MISSYRTNAYIVPAKSERLSFLFRKMRRFKTFIRRKFFLFKAKPCEYNNCLYGHSHTSNIYQTLIYEEKFYVHSECLEHSKKAKKNKDAELLEYKNKQEHENAIRKAQTEIEIRQEAYTRWLNSQLEREENEPVSKAESDADKCMQIKLGYPKMIESRYSPAMGQIVESWQQEAEIDRSHLEKIKESRKKHGRG
jgi:hypothetical protein